MTDHAALLVTTVASTLEAFLLPLADALRARGWRVHALARDATGSESLAEGFDGAFDATWSRRLVDPGNFVGAPARVRQVNDRGAYSIVHVHTPIAGFVTRYALRRARASGAPRVIYTAHGFHFFEGGDPMSNSIFRSAERVAARWTDYLVTMNAEDYAAARGLGGIDPKRVRFIPGVGIDTSEYAADDEAGSSVRAALGLSSDAFVITMIAEMNPNKRHSLVLDAFASVRNPRATLMLVGEGPLEGDLRVHATALGIADRVLFLGQRDDVPAILAASDVLTLASQREGLPRAVLEAMSAGVPVVATKTRGVVDAVDDSVGWLVGGGDPAALAAAYDFVAEHPGQAATRSQAGIARVRERYGMQSIIPAYLDLYDEAIH